MIVINRGYGSNVLSGVRILLIVCQLDLKYLFLDFFRCGSTPEVVVSYLEDDVSDLFGVTDLRHFVDGLRCCIPVVFDAVGL